MKYYNQYREKKIIFILNRQIVARLWNVLPIEKISAIKTSVNNFFAGSMNIFLRLQTFLSLF